MAVRIIAIRKDGGNHYNPHQAVSHYEWHNESTNNTGVSDRSTMVNWCLNGGHAYVKSPQGTANCFVNTSNTGTKFLQTNADSQSTNNLLNLPSC